MPKFPPTTTRGQDSLLGPAVIVASRRPSRLSSSCSDSTRTEQILVGLTTHANYRDVVQRHQRIEPTLVGCLEHHVTRRDRHAFQTSERGPAQSGPSDSWGASSSAVGSRSLGYKTTAVAAYRRCALPGCWGAPRFHLIEPANSPAGGTAASSLNWPTPSLAASYPSSAGITREENPRPRGRRCREDCRASPPPCVPVGAPRSCRQCVCSPFAPSTPWVRPTRLIGASDESGGAIERYPRVSHWL